MTLWEMSVSTELSRQEYERFMGLHKTKKMREPRRHGGRLRKLTKQDRDKRQARRERNGTLTGAEKVRAKRMGGKEVPR